MASPSLLRSAVGRVLRRSYLQGPSPRSPRVFFSGVAGRIGPCKLPSHAEGERICRLEMVLDLFQAHLRQTQALIDFLLEEEKRSQRSEQLQKKIACVLVPATAALYIFGPDKKEKSPAEGQSSM